MKIVINKPQKSNIIYLSYFMDKNTPIYGGGKGVEVIADRSIENGDTANTKFIKLSNHSGTHIDFPNHFIDKGKKSDNYNADFWVFNKPTVIKKTCIENEIIDLSDIELEKIPFDIDILILKTDFYKYRGTDKYWLNNPGISPNLAKTLRYKFPKLRAIGMDLISVTSFQNRILGREAHNKFLEGDNPILLIEDMDLRFLNKIPKQIICLPIMISKLDGAPITIIAIY